MRKFAPILVAFLLVACGGESKDQPESGAAGTAQDAMSGGADQAAAPPTALTGEPGRVVAKVGKDEITLREVDLLAGTLRRNRPGANPAELQKMALDNLIDQQVLVRTAEKMGLGPSDEDFQSAVSQIASQFPDPAAFDQAIQQQGMTRADFDKNFRNELTIQKLIEVAFQDTVEVTEAEARAYYDANAQEFKTPETVHARHILIRVEPTAPPEADAAAKTRAQAALDRVKKGEDFIKVADEVTEDPSGKGRGGDLGFFPRERMVPPFSDAAFSLQPGQVSDLVKTQFGYHVIKVEERKEPGVVDFGAISGQLIQNLEQQATAEGVRAFLEKEKAKLDIEREI